MPARFVVFTNVDNADYVIDDYGFKYVEFSAEETAKIMQAATQYKVVKREVEHYYHEEMGDYTSIRVVATHELDKVKSISEKVWLKNEGACDIIVDGGTFFGVVFFTGFTDYRGEEQYGFIPLEHIHDRKNLSDYCSAEISILLPPGATLPVPDATKSLGSQETGRTTRSWNTNFTLEKK